MSFFCLSISLNFLWLVDLFFQAVCFCSVCFSLVFTWLARRVHLHSEHGHYMLIYQYTKELLLILLSFHTGLLDLELLKKPIVRKPENQGGRVRRWPLQSSQDWREVRDSRLWRRFASIDGKGTRRIEERRLTYLRGGV